MGHTGLLIIVFDTMHASSYLAIVCAACPEIVVAFTAAYYDRLTGIIDPKV